MRWLVIGRGANEWHSSIDRAMGVLALSSYAVSTGELAGDCSGQFTFVGQMDAGATCSFSTFQGIARGLPGVRRFAGVAPLGILPARLYDKDGNIVGSENAQVDTLANAPNFPNCNTTEGFTEGNFSSVIELFGDRW